MTNTTNTDKFIIEGLKRELERQRNEYERQIAQLKTQNEYLTKQLEVQKQRNAFQTRENRVTSLANSHLRGEMMRVR